MKKVCSVVWCLVALCGLCSQVFAQEGFPAGAWTSGSGLPCAQGSEGIGLPSVYVGWLEHRQGSSWTIQRPDGAGTAAWPLRGLWLGAEQHFRGCEGIGLLVSGSLFLPQHSYGAWVSSPGSTDYNFEIPSYEWWSADGLVTKQVSGAFEVLAGLRWDHSSVRVTYSDQTDDDYILNTYLPLVGVQMAERSSNGSLIVRVLGTPVALGSLKYNFWTGTGYAEQGNFTPTNSYFVELFTEYTRSMGGNLAAGIFAKWNALSLNTGTHHLSGSTTEAVSWNVNIRSLVIGGSVSLGFSLPW